MNSEEVRIHHGHHAFHRAMAEYHAKSNATLAEHHEALADTIEKCMAKCGHPVPEETSTSKFFEGDGTSLEKVFGQASPVDSELVLHTDDFMEHLKG